MNRELRTEIAIDARPAEVWKHLTALSAYGEWNPFITSADGVVAVGQRLSLRMEPPGGRAMRFKPTVTVVREGEVLEWLGHLGIPGVFDGRHRFDLRPNGLDGTHLIQSEMFAGLLVRLPLRRIEEQTRAGFEAMNDALRARAIGRA